MPNPITTSGTHITTQNQHPEQRARDSIDALPHQHQSILKKDFSGQLVTQDPNDEPASKLLARIQAEKAAMIQPSQKRAIDKIKKCGKK